MKIIIAKNCSCQWGNEGLGSFGGGCNIITILSQRGGEGGSGEGQIYSQHSLNVNHFSLI